MHSPGASLDQQRFSNAAGTRAYRLYVPSGYRGQEVPLVVLLHGGMQSASDFARGTAMNQLAQAQGFLVAYPEQSSAANNLRYWNWFLPEHQRAGGGEPSIIAGITRQIADRYAVDASRVWVAGFSAGGAMAAVMAATYPDLYRAAGVHSGLAYGAARDLPGALRAMSQAPESIDPLPLGAARWIVVHGARDPVVSHSNAESLVCQVLTALGPAQEPSVSRGVVPGGHSFTRTLYEDRHGHPLVEQLSIHQAGHAWSGGSPDGSYTDPLGPDASRAVIGFFWRASGVQPPD